MLDKTERACILSGKFLYFFAAYTVTIKYLMPVAWAAIEQAPLLAHIYFWDAWWILHIAVGFGLCRRTKGIWPWAFLLAIAEIIIIVTKFVFYFASPNTSFWHLNWLVNKSLLLIYFFVFLLWLCRQEVRKLL